MMPTKELTSPLIKETVPDAMMHRGACANLDTCVDWGVYYTTSTTEGTLPPKMGTLARYAVLEVTRRYEWVFQRLTSESNLVAIRTRNMSGIWSAWKEMAFQ